MEPTKDSASEATGATGGNDLETEAQSDAVRIAAETAERKAADEARAAKERAKLLEGMKALSAADILADVELATEWVPVPRWGGKVLVRELTGTERDEFETSIVVVKGKQRTTNTENIRAKLAQLTIVDPTDPKQRARLFTRKQIDALGKKDAASLDLIYDVAARLSGLSNADTEELEGNSGAAGGGGS